MRRVGFILKPDKSAAGQLVADLVAWLLERGDQPVLLAEDQLGVTGARVAPEERFADEIDLAVVLGGDGTMLRASALVAEAGIPVLGVNLGRLGFLTPFDPGEARAAIVLALEGSLPRAERSRLSATYFPVGGGAPVTRTALNDAIIHQGAMARLVELEARLDDRLIATYRADGLIVCTPTGSTAYNLAAGGPILMPEQRALTITPICAHALTNRPLVVNEGVISFALAGESRGAMLTLDGQWGHTFSQGDRVEITLAPRPLIVFLSDDDYFDILREKLHWGARSER
jgi:NAD+ kinase